MKLINTEQPGLVRDVDSKAILFSDNRAREEYRARLSEKKKTQEELNNLKETVNNLQSEISELKGLLIDVVQIVKENKCLTQSVD